MINGQMFNIKTWIRSFMKDRSGATSAEYGILVSAVAVVIIATVSLLGGSLKDLFANVGACETAMWADTAVCSDPGVAEGSEDSGESNLGFGG
jgi:pilus assembly protein Flp/PilA